MAPHTKSLPFLQFFLHKTGGAFGLQTERVADQINFRRPIFAFRDPELIPPLP